VVKLGFIVEGDSEKVLVESESFKQWLRTQGLELCPPVINAKGGGNLLPQNIEPMIAQIRASRPDHIVIMTDLEAAPSIAAVKARITTQHTDLIFVAVKALEAWFLADTAAMRRWLEKDDFFEAHPEQTPGMPWERLKVIANTLKVRGPGANKVIFAKRMCDKHGFQVDKASAHPNCPSAKQFHDGLLGLVSPSP
jgi:hypothetical protein